MLLLIRMRSVCIQLNTNVIRGLVKRAQLLWHVHKCWETCATSLTRAQHLSNVHIESTWKHWVGAVKHAIPIYIYIHIHTAYIHIYILHAYIHTYIYIYTASKHRPNYFQSQNRWISMNQQTEWHIQCKPVLSMLFEPRRARAKLCQAFGGSAGRAFSRACRRRSGVPGHSASKTCQHASGAGLGKHTAATCWYLLFRSARKHSMRWNSVRYLLFWT